VPARLRRSVGRCHFIAFLRFSSKTSPKPLGVHPLLGLISSAMSRVMKPDLPVALHPFSSAPANEVTSDVLSNLSR
jgi:hypothetical protein